MKPICNIPPFGLRLQPELKEWVKRKAAENKRSVNSEIVVRIEKSREQEIGAEIALPK